MLKHIIACSLWLCFLLFGGIVPQLKGQSVPAAPSDEFVPLVSDLKPPVVISSIESLRDGGTTSVVLEDSVGTIFLFCLDRRLDEGGYDFPGNVYVGVLHPNDAARMG